MDILKRPRILIGGDDETPDPKPKTKPKAKTKDSLDDLLPKMEEPAEGDGSADDGYFDDGYDDPDDPTPAEDLKTLAELGFTEEPYVIQFKEKYGKFPTMEVNDFCRLPTRFSTPSGERKFHMKTTYRPGQHFQIVGTEPGKRTPTSVNIVLLHPTDRDSQIVITPKDLIAKMHVNVTESRSDIFEDDPITSIPTKNVSEDVKEILEKRKKEAAVSI